MSNEHEKEMARRSAAAAAEFSRLVDGKREKAVLTNALSFFTETRAEGVTRAHAIKVLQFLTATDPVAQEVLAGMLAQEPQTQPPQLALVFVRKPGNFDTLLAESRFGEPKPIYVDETVKLTTDEYDFFANHLNDRWAWLEGKGGHRVGMVCCVAVAAPERRTLYVNPEGYDYGRYVAVGALG